MTYRAYCDDCNWVSDEAWRDEENAYTDMNQHVQEEHAYQWGVRAA